MYEWGIMREGDGHNKSFISQVRWWLVLQSIRQLLTIFRSEISCNSGGKLTVTYLKNMVL